MALDEPLVMGVLNVTPDSFSDGGQYLDPGAAVARALQMVSEGARAIDVGGESTRPGAARVNAQEQAARVLPVICAMRRESALDGVAISIDTTQASLARAAAENGADIVNDVSSGAEDASMFSLVARLSLGMILMHRLRAPGEDSYSDTYASPPSYRDVREEVGEFLRGRVTRAGGEGIQEDAIATDPGLGFGKSVEQNMLLLRPPADVSGLGLPVVSALSRKSFVGSVMCAGRGNVPPSERLPGTLALSVLHRLAGASIFRVHDPGPVASALRAAEAARDAWTRPSGVNTIDA